MELAKFKWTREPESYKMDQDTIEIVTKPHTDLWQRTYYQFQNDNAPVLQMETEERYFSFVVKTEFEESHHRFDQCGIVMYLDSENWLKASIEYENDEYQHLGSVVTNHGYSDWATTVIDASVKSMWYRFSRREDDYRIECSADGVTFNQMRICHMHSGKGKIQFGIYACSPEDSTFKAVFSNMQIMDCQWKAHDGQQADKKQRCAWANPNNERYIRYHDEEWGVPSYDDHKLFEMLILESFQAGLSWECVLNKREHFRHAFDQFDLEKVCAYTDEKLMELQQNKNIIRNKLKIRAAVNNARIFREIQQEYGTFSNYLWHWSDGKVIYEQGMAHSELSDAVSSDLKKRGMKFVGTTIIYAYLQAVGVINSHDTGCFLEHAKEAD